MRIYRPVAWLTAEQKEHRRRQERKYKRNQRAKQRDLAIEARRLGRPLPRKPTTFIRSGRFKTARAHREWQRAGRPPEALRPPPKAHNEAPARSYPAWYPREKEDLLPKYHITSPMWSWMWRFQKSAARAVFGLPRGRTPNTSSCESDKAPIRVDGRTEVELLYDSLPIQPDPLDYEPPRLNLVCHPLHEAWQIPCPEPPF